MGGQISDILKYFDFSRPSKFGVKKPKKGRQSIEHFISQKVNKLKHLYIVLLKGDIKT